MCHQLPLVSTCVSTSGEDFCLKDNNTSRVDGPLLSHSSIWGLPAYQDLVRSIQDRPPSVVLSKCQYRLPCSVVVCSAPSCPQNSNPFRPRTLNKGFGVWGLGFGVWGLG